MLLSLDGDGVHLPPHLCRLLLAGISRGPGRGVAGGLLDGVPNMWPFLGLLLDGSPLLPTHRCLRSHGGGHGGPFSPAPPPPKNTPLRSHSALTSR